MLSLSLIFSRSMSSGEVPTDWRCANILPLLKGGDARLASNYRSISLTSVCWKRMERIIRDQLWDYTSEGGRIASNQHGLSPGKSCTSNLMEINEFVSPANDNAFLDGNLREDGEMDSSLVTEESSTRYFGWDVFGLESRVYGNSPGSVLGPLLFSIYMDDLIVQSPVCSLKFAGDSKIFSTVNSVHDETKVQGALDQVHEWSINNQMVFNATPNFEFSISLKASPGLSYSMSHLVST